jgi:hypothetical protein
VLGALAALAIGGTNLPFRAFKSSAFH